MRLARGADPAAAAGLAERDDRVLPRPRGRTPHGGLLAAGAGEAGDLVPKLLLHMTAREALCCWGIDGANLIRPFSRELVSFLGAHRQEMR